MPMLADDDLRVDAGLFDPPEHLDDAADRPARGVGHRVISTMHHLARLGGARLARRHVDVREDTAIERHDVAELRGSSSNRPTTVAWLRSRIRMIRPSGPRSVLPLDAGDDTVAVHRLHQLPAAT